MPDFDSYDRAEDRFDRIAKEISDEAVKEPVAKDFDPHSVRSVWCSDGERSFKYKHYKFEYRAAIDQIVLLDLKAEENIDKEEIRVTNNFRKVNISDDRYSGETFKIEINDYKQWGEWWIVEPMFIYMLIVHFDLTEIDATNMVSAMSVCLPLN